LNPNCLLKAVAKKRWWKEITVDFLNEYIACLCGVEQIKLGDRSAFEIQIIRYGKCGKYD